MAQLDNWGNLYTELADILSDLQEIQWTDLWHNQINMLEGEHPFPTPAAFIAMRMGNPTDIGLKVQETDVQVDIYYYYETFADTFNGSYNQTDALDYLNALTSIHRVLHGSSGNTYSEMRRIGFGSVNTGGAGNLYRLQFSCKVVDVSAVAPTDEAIPGDISLSQGEAPAEPDNEPVFIVGG